MFFICISFFLILFTPEIAEIPENCSEASVEERTSPAEKPTGAGQGSVRDVSSGNLFMETSNSKTVYDKENHV